MMENLHQSNSLHHLSFCSEHAASDLLDTAVHGHAACFLWLRSNRPELTTGHTIKPTVVTQGMSIEK